jgi:hypothetical protein
VWYAAKEYCTSAEHNTLGKKCNHAGLLIGHCTLLLSILWLIMDVQKGIERLGMSSYGESARDLKTKTPPYQAFSQG